MAALILLGFSSGLPFYLTGKDPLQAWLSQEGVDLKVIAAFSVAAIPYSLKFLWSPLLDRFVPPLLGRRRGWLIVSQVILLLAIGWMAFQDTSQLQQVAVNSSDVCRNETFFKGFCEFRHTLQALSVSPFFLAALIVAFFSASQDIVADAYRTEVVQEHERGAGASVYLLGYRVALLVAGAVTFWLAGRMSWRWVYVIMALLMSIGIISSLMAPEPKREIRPPETLRESVVLPFQDFIGRNGAGRALAILVFIIVYRLGDSLLRNVATPFLLDKGLKFTPDDLAGPRALSLAAVIVGTLAGGVIMTRIGVNRSLWFFAVLQASGNLLYVLLAEVGKNFQLMTLAINLENFCAGLESAAFVAFLMGLCNPGLSATQYALLSSLAAFSRDILVAPSGQWAQSMGWTAFFLLTAILTLPGLLLLPFFAPWKEKAN
ncbi:AmpG family muropeptide MFS transporter [Pseudanabaenaceae cyanobacterium LEGE 13415]|nr:AmpG family muropeptide MFS transporter [Pseudanabaenaceae cyanobacterium LEGE 13415]